MLCGPLSTSSAELPSSSHTEAYLVVVSARDASQIGARFALDQTLIRIGRGSANDIVVDEEIVSRRHARVEQSGESWLLIDDDSANGTLRNDVPLSGDARLHNRDRIKVGSTVFLFLCGDEAEADYCAELARLEKFDGLTLIHNERHLFDDLEHAIHRAREHVLSLALLRIEIEDMERVHEVHGSMASDFVLVETARILRARVRRGETLARVGERGFAVVLPEASLSEAESLGVQIQLSIEDHVFEYRCDAIQIDVCVGAARLTVDDHSALDLFRRAAPWREFDDED